jgi:hypothetical protein
MATRILAAVAFGCTFLASRVAAAGDPAVSVVAPASAWAVEPRALIGGAWPLGSAARLYGGAIDLGVGVGVGLANSPLRWRATADTRLGMAVGAGASLSLHRLGHIVTALEVGPTLRRLSLGNEIASTTLGGSLVAEMGWRFQLHTSWVVSLGARGSLALYRGDGFTWNDLGVCLAFERVAR